MPDINGKDEESPALTSNAPLSRWPENQANVTIWKENYKGDEDNERPWFRYILEDGSLFYLEPAFDLSYEDDLGEGANESSPKHSDKGDKKGESRGILRGFGRIKGALKRNTTFAKKEKEVERNGEVAKDGSRSMNENNGAASNGLGEALYDIQIVRSTTVVKVNKKLPADLEMKSNLLHEVLGIISGLDLDPVQPLSNGTSDTAISRRLDAIAIQGIVAESPADINEDINIDDMLLAVNGVEVSERNINYVLSKINWPAEVVLTIEKVVHVPAMPRLKSRLIDLMTGAIDDDNTLVAYQEDCAVMYLTLDADENDPDGDILFHYPESQNFGKFKKIRGLFLTLSDLMPSVTGTELKTSTLLLSEKIVHVCYQKVGKNVLVVAAPDTRCSLFRIEEAVKELVRQMEYLYESVEKAFEVEYKEDVRHMFLLFMERLLGGLPVRTQSEASNLTAYHLNGVKYLQLPSDNYVLISNILSDAEAADYGIFADKFFPHRRLYTNLGSCLFYKGHLVCNHLPNDDLIDAMVFCKHHYLLAMAEEQRVNQLVVWKEVYPVRRQHDDKISDSECFEEPTGRWFLLVVAQKHSLLCTLLETGGASSSPLGSPGPHPYYVDRALSILAFIQERLDFETICEARLRGASIPAISPIKSFTSSRQTSNNSHQEITLRKLPAHLETMGIEHSPSMDSLRLGGNHGDESPRQNSKTSSPFFHRFSEARTSDDSGSNSSSVRMSESGFSTTSNYFKNNHATCSDHMSRISTKLTAGAANTLFYYTMCDNAKGILLCPTTSSSDMINKEVLDNFYKACELIRRTFNRDCDRKVNGENNDVGSLNTDKVYEQGLLFRRKPTKGGDSRKSQNVLKYWVVGRRLMDSTREFFVCFHDGLPQSAIELAFKFGFGTVI